MRQITVNILKYAELSPSAKETARQNYAATEGFISGDEALASIKALAEHFGGKVANYEIDWSGGFCHSTMSFEMPLRWSPRTEIERRLIALGDYNSETLKGLGDCKLTGVCYDEDAIDGFRKAWHDGERNINKLMEAAFRSLLAHCHSEYEDFYTDESFAEHADANDYEYYEDGSPV